MPGMTSGRAGQRLNLNLQPVAGTLILLLIVLASLARGLFFREDLLQFQVGVAVVFGLAWLDRIAKGDGVVIAGWADALPLLLSMAYLVSISVAVDKRAAVGEALKYATLFMVYWTVARLSYSRRWAAYFIYTVIFTGCLVSAIGLAAAGSVIDLPGAFVSGDILSTFQYPNALGGVVAAVCIMTTVVWGAAGVHPGDETASESLGLGVSGLGGWIREALCSFAFVVCGTVLVFTGSRGSWMMFPLLLVLAVVGNRKGSRFGSALRASLGTAAVLLIARRMDSAISAASRAVRDGTPEAAVSAASRMAVYIAAASAGVFLAIVLLHVGIGLLERSRAPGQTVRVVQYVFGLWMVATVLWYGAYAGAAYPGGGGLLGRRAARAIESVRADNPSLIARKVFWLDALEIVADRPVLGAGGGGWNALYHKYQDELYSSALVHSHPLEVAVETGLPGLAIYAGMWIVLFRNGWLFWRAQAEDVLDPEDLDRWPVFWAALCGAVTLGAHSAMDFDFSLAAIAAMAWGLMACANACVEGPSGDSRGGLWRGPVIRPARAVVRLLIGIALCLCVGLPSVRLSEGMAKGAAGARAMLNGEYAAAEGYYREAIRLDPYSASYWVDLAQVSLASYAFEPSPSRLQAARDACEMALTVQPSYLPSRVRVTEIFASLGDVERAAECAAETVTWLPRDIRSYEGLARAYAGCSAKAVGRGDKQQARGYAEKAREVLSRAEEALRGTAKPVETPAMCYGVGQAVLMLGDYPEAARMFRKAASMNVLAADAQVWLGACLERMADSRGAEKAFEEAKSKLGEAVFNSRREEIERLCGALQ